MRLSIGLAFAIMMAASGCPSTGNEYRCDSDSCALTKTHRATGCAPFPTRLVRQGRPVAFAVPVADGALVLVGGDLW